MRFICDNTLGALARHLRMLGLDVQYCRGREFAMSTGENPDNPVLFTRKTKAVSYKPVVRIRSNDIMGQIKEVEDFVRPYIDPAAFLNRCIRCNTVLETVSKDLVETRVPEYVLHTNEVFRLCPTCKKVYWHGTHAERMAEWRRTLHGKL
ncbi:MAG TPA: Mut7-C RNAse domain-containing protein [Syntrophorhabdaceae bacterium]|nr:Mut7-C RNAse domain-containing protein [Syntrophorhabdaceae bacterium]